MPEAALAPVIPEPDQLPQPSPTPSVSEVFPPTVPGPTQPPPQAPATTTTSPSPSIETGQIIDKTSSCPSDPPGPAPTLAGGTAHAESGEALLQLPEGPLASAWLLIPLVLGLLAASLVRQRARATAPEPEQSDAAATADLGASLPKQRRRRPGMPPSCLP